MPGGPGVHKGNCVEETTLLTSSNCLHILDIEGSITININGKTINLQLL